MKEEKKKIKLDFIRKMGKSKTYRQNAGITLIALVVTIIILLILAGVTISLVIGDNGLIGRTQASATTTQMARIIEDGNMAIAAIQTDKLPKGDFSLTLDEVVAEMNNHYGYNGKIAPIDASGTITSITAVKTEIDDLAVGETGTITITPTTGGSAYYIEIYGLYYMLTLNNGKLEISQNGNKLEDLTGGGEYTLTATSNNTEYVEVTETNPTTRTITLQGIASTKELQTKPQITISYGKAGGQTASTTVTVNVLGKYTVTVVAGENGTVSPSGEQQVTEGQSITVTATGNTGETNYKFASWSDGTTTYTTSNTWEYTPTGNVTLTAIFDEDRDIKVSDYGKDIKYNEKTYQIFLVDKEGKYSNGKSGVWIQHKSSVELNQLMQNLEDTGIKTENSIFWQLNPDLNNSYGTDIRELNSLNENLKAVAYLCNPENWNSSYVKSEDVANGVYAVGAVSAEMYCDSYNQKWNLTIESSTYYQAKAFKINDMCGYLYRDKPNANTSYDGYYYYTSNMYGNNMYTADYQKYRYLSSPCADTTICGVWYGNPSSCLHNFRITDGNYVRPAIFIPYEIVDIILQ